MRHKNLDHCLAMYPLQMRATSALTSPSVDYQLMQVTQFVSVTRLEQPKGTKGKMGILPLNSRIKGRPGGPQYAIFFEKQGVQGYQT